ncbi:chemotaxis protein CheX [Povalibacter sp.]|uniref:chemotaxis protein CheX n=1 Tax=Povalibacter sp. TaxID=1962978 RepID=UPI002F427A30
MTSAFSISLSELELDALTELVNLGVSGAALSLREMVHEEVVLSVPKVAVVTREQAIATLGEQESKRLVAVQQDFAGDISGRALLIFPETKSMELVRAVVGGNLSLEDIAELEQEALAETGNVLLNGCLGTIANNLQRSLRISLPEVIYGDGAEFFAAIPSRESGYSVLFIHINFAVRNRDIRGYIAMLLDIPSQLALKDLIGAFIERTTGQVYVPSSNVG